jgi:hypothetical protein
MRYVMPEFSSERSEQLAEASFLAGKGKRRTPDESRRYEELKLEIKYGKHCCEYQRGV